MDREREVEKQRNRTVAERDVRDKDKEMGRSFHSGIHGNFCIHQTVFSKRISFSGVRAGSRESSREWSWTFWGGVFVLSSL